MIEVRRGNRQDRRRHGKSDTTDAISAARAVQSGQADGVAKTADGSVESIRLLLVARRSAMKARSQTANQILSIIDTAPEELRSRFHGRPVRDVVTVVARFHRSTLDTPFDAAKCTLRHLACRWHYLSEEIAELDEYLDELTAETAPTLVALNGAGTQTAAAPLVAAGDNPHRLGAAKSFAALCGASPTDASTGRQERHRLNRGGDRQANAALHHRHLTTPLGPHQPGLHGPPPSPRQEPQRSHPLPQALRRPRSPPSHPHRPRTSHDHSPRTRLTRCLTSIEASGLGTESGVRRCSCRLGHRRGQLAPRIEHARFEKSPFHNLTTGPSTEANSASVFDV